MNVIYDPIETDIYYRHKDIHTSPFPHYHKHDAYEIFLLLNGDACYYIEQSCYHISRGSMLVIQPGEYHRITLNNPNVYDRISLNIKQNIFDQYSTSRTELSACFSDRPFGQ